MKKLSFVLVILIFFTSCASNKLSYDKELSHFQYPFEVNTFVLRSQNQELDFRYMDVGNKSSKKVALLLHGKNFSGYYWERVAKELVEKNFRVIIPDQIGFGKSSKPRAYQYSFGQLALNTKSLLDYLNIDSVRVVGHSMGGMLASTFAVEYPKITERLILINPIGLENYGKYAQAKDVNFFYNIEKSKTLIKARNYQKKNYYDGNWSPEYEKLLIPLKGLLNGNDWDTVAWSNALTYGPIFSENLPSRFSEIKVKTYLIIGTRDKTGPGRAWLKEGVKRKLGEYKKLGRLTKKRIKNSTLFELKGLGHMPQFEDYLVFKKVFLKSIL
ncbi:MAG: alpha/beta hydrolase [Oligoflexia bacterium]|nr:alpha/beta hydrolase [Oligoflexia bacterium]